MPWLAKPTGKPSQVYRKAVEDFLSANGSFDAAIVVVLNEHEKLPDTDNPYLHSKAVLLMAGIPVQDVRVSTISQPEMNLQYSLQNIAVALYAKLNGIPWTVDHDLSIADELVIGVGTCELLESRFVEKQRFIGITTVFRGDGNYLLSNLSSECSYQDYPAVLEKSTVQILEEIKRRNGWQREDTVRVVVHSFKPKNVEVGQIMRKCVESVGNEQNIEFAFLTVTQDHSFLILDKEQRGIAVRNKHGAFKATYVPMRGLISQLGSFTRLLCTNGPELIKRETLPFSRSVAGSYSSRINLSLLVIPDRASAEIYVLVMAFHVAGEAPCDNLLFRFNRGPTESPKTRSRLVTGDAQRKAQGK